MIVPDFGEPTGFYAFSVMTNSFICLLGLFGLLSIYYFSNKKTLGTKTQIILMVPGIFQITFILSNEDLSSTGNWGLYLYLIILFVFNGFCTFSALILTRAEHLYKLPMYLSVGSTVILIIAIILTELKVMEPLVWQIIAIICTLPFFILSAYYYSLLSIRHRSPESFFYILGVILIFIGEITFFLAVSPGGW